MSRWFLKIYCVSWGDDLSTKSQALIITSLPDLLPLKTLALVRCNPAKVHGEVWNVDDLVYYDHIELMSTVSF